MLLVTGGSSGARRINDAVIASAARDHRRRMAGAAPGGGLREGVADPGLPGYHLLAVLGPHGSRIRRGRPRDLARRLGDRERARRGRAPCRLRPLSGRKRRAGAQRRRRGRAPGERCSSPTATSPRTGWPTSCCRCSRTRRASPTWRPGSARWDTATAPIAWSIWCSRRGTRAGRRDPDATGSVIGMIKPDLTMELPAELGALHFTGIGGSGMSGIARLFLDAGYRVTGSDLRDTDAVRELREAGATVAIGHDAANVGDADTLVVTGALWQDNPEYQFALASGIPVLHRSQALAWLISRQRLIAVAGAHGKTTSTGMIVTALRELGADPSFVNGGVIAGLGRSAASGIGRAVRRRGRRVGRLVPALRHGGRAHHERRRRPPGPLRHPGGVRGRLRDVRAAGVGVRRRLERRPGHARRDGAADRPATS